MSHESVPLSLDPEKDPTPGSWSVRTGDTQEQRKNKKKNKGFRIRPFSWTLHLESDSPSLPKQIPIPARLPVFLTRLLSTLILDTEPKPSGLDPQSDPRSGSWIHSGTCAVSASLTQHEQRRRRRRRRRVVEWPGPAVYRRRCRVDLQALLESDIHKRGASLPAASFSTRQPSRFVYVCRAR